MPNRFAKQQRLLRPQQFSAVFAQPQKVVSSHLVMLATANTEMHPRLGLAITKKVLRRAVQRNRVKRVVRESFRHCQEQLMAIDVVVLARRGIEQLDKAALRQQTDQLWQRLQKRFRK